MRKGLLLVVFLLFMLVSACSSDGTESETLEGIWSYPNLTISVPDGYGIQVEDIQLSTADGVVITSDFVASEMTKIGNRWEVTFTQQGDHSGRINIVVSVPSVSSLEPIAVR